MVKLISCPCCGASRAEALQVTVDAQFQTVERAGVVAVLGAAQFEIFGLLRSAAPRPAYTDWLMQQSGQKPAHLRKLIWKLRANLSPLGLSISSSVATAGVEGSFYLLQVAQPARQRPPRPRLGARPRLVCVG